MNALELWIFIIELLVGEGNYYLVEPLADMVGIIGIVGLAVIFLLIPFVFCIIVYAGIKELFRGY